MFNANSIKILVIAASLDEYLIVKIVRVLGNEGADIAHDLYNICTLFQRLAGQMSLQYMEAIQMIGQAAHLIVGLPVVKGHRREIVKGSIEVLFDIVSYVDERIEKPDWLQMY